MARFNLYSSEFDANPFDTYKELRDNHPCFWSEDAQKWVLTRHSDVVNALNDWQTYSSAKGNLVDEFPGRAGNTLGTMDPPKHHEVRGIIQSVFMKRNLGHLVEPIQDIARNRSFDTIDFNSDLNNPDADSTTNENRYEAMKEAVMEVVGGHFRPEFINRIDEVVVFHPLGQSQIRGIANIQLDQLRQRLLERELGFDISDSALDKLAAVGFDPVYGARPLKRAIQQYIENPLAQDVLGGKFVPGDTIVIDTDGREIVMKSKIAG